MFLCYHTLFSVLRPYERLGLQVSTRPFFTPSLFSLYECAYHIRTLVCVLSFKGKEGRDKCVLCRCLLYFVVRTCLHPGNHCKSLTTTIYCGVYLNEATQSVSCIVNHVTCKPYILDVTQLFQSPYTYARSAQLSMHVFWKWRGTPGGNLLLTSPAVYTPLCHLWQRSPTFSNYAIYEFFQGF